MTAWGPKYWRGSTFLLPSKRVKEDFVTLLHYRLYAVAHSVGPSFYLRRYFMDHKEPSQKS